MDRMGIETAQNVVLEQELAGVGNRMVAFIIDALVLWAWWMVWSLIAAFFGVGGSSWVFLPSVIGVLPILFYSLVCEVVRNGQSIGKSAMKIKVARLDGAQPTIGQYLMRWVLRLIDVWFFAIGVLVMMLTRNCQRLGDLAAGTTVVSVRPRATLDDVRVADVRPGHVVRFPQAIRLSDQQATLIKEVLNNRKVVSRTQLIAETAERVKHVIGVPDIGPSSEQFLRIVLQDHSHLTAGSGSTHGV